MDVSQFPTLDRELAAALADLPDRRGAAYDLGAARAALASFAPRRPVPGEELLDIDDLVVKGTRLRLYRPRTATTRGVLYLHGGGFCTGSVETEHAHAVQIANDVDAVVVSVDYRLAPEDPYPAAADDCYRGLQHLATLCDKIAVHGQSAGAGLAAATALKARDLGGPAIAFQSLCMPQLDDRLQTPSMQAFTDTPMWSRPQAVTSWQLYLGGRAADRYAAPCRADDLSGLPPAHLTVMELDPLRDEGITYAMRMLQDGVSVELHTYPGTFHASSFVVTAAVSRRIVQDSLDALRRGLI